MAIWNVSNRELSRINLLKTSNGNYRVIQYGEFGLLLTGSDYTLINKCLLPAFELLLSDQIETIKVSISRVSNGDHWDDYLELVIKNHINPEHLQTTDSFGEQVWQFRHHLFVSSDLKDKLKELGKDQLEFSEGFSHFA